MDTSSRSITSRDANRYRITNPLGDAQVVNGGWRYKTRIIIAGLPTLRGSTAPPQSMDHVTTGQDIDFDWAASHDSSCETGTRISPFQRSLSGSTR